MSCSHAHPVLLSAAGKQYLFEVLMSQFADHQGSPATAGLCFRCTVLRSPTYHNETKCMCCQVLDIAPWMKRLI